MEEQIIFNLEVADSKLIAQLEAAQKETQRLKTELKSLNEERKKGTLSEAEYNTKLAQNTAEQIKSSKALQGAKKDIKDYQRDVNSSTGSLEQLRAQLIKDQKEYDNLSKSQRENQDVGGKLLKSIKEQDAALKELESQTGRNQRNVGNYKEAITGLVGDFRVFGVSLNQVKGGLEQFRAAQIASTAATSGASKGLQLFKIALISTGIGAIVVIIGTLVAAFLSTQEGVDAVTKALQPLQIAFQRLIGFFQNSALGIFDRFKQAIDNPKQALIDLGDVIRNQIQNRIQGLIDLVTGAIEVLTALPKAITSGDFSQVNTALEKTGNGFIAFNTGVNDGIGKLKEFGDQVGDTVDEINKDAQRLNEIYDELNRLNRTQANDLAKLNVVIQENQLIARNQAKSLEERTNALNALKQAIEDKTAIEERNIALQIEELELRQKQNRTGQKELEQLDSLRASLTQLQAQRNQQLRETLEIENTLRNQQKKLLADQLKAEQDALKQLQDIRLQNTLDSIKDEQERARKELEIQKQAELDSIELLKVSEEIKSQLRLAFNERYLRQISELNEQVKELNQDRIEEAQLQDLKDQEATFELRKLNAENLFEVGQLELEILKNKQAQELLLFEGSEEQKTLLLAQQTKQREQFAINFAKVQRDKNIEVADSFAGLFNSIAQLAGESAVLQKAAALFQIGVDTAKGISGAIAAGAGLIFPANLPAIATGVGAVVSGIAQAKQVLSATPTFAKGGTIPAQTGGMITGNSHAQGGVRFAVGGQVMEAEGGEIIVNKNIQSRPDYMAAISRMNAETGGVDFFKGGGGRKFAAGGTVSRTASQPVFNSVQSQNDIANILRNQPSPVVLVQDIQTGVGQKVRVEQRADIS